MYPNVLNMMHQHASTANHPFAPPSGNVGFAGTAFSSPFCDFSTSLMLSQCQLELLARAMSVSYKSESQLINGLEYRWYIFHINEVSPGYIVFNSG